jgi:hypothetical protein
MFIAYFFCYAEYRLFVVALRVVMLCVVMLSVVMLSVVMPSVLMMRADCYAECC